MLGFGPIGVARMSVAGSVRIVIANEPRPLPVDVPQKLQRDIYYLALGRPDRDL